jgi:hypothetical protein
MRKRLSRLLAIAILILILPSMSYARGTRYIINWPKGHIGPIYLQVFDIRCHRPFELIERFKVWVTWGKQTKCYDMGNYGVYTIMLYKYKHNPGPMIISGNAASFKIRYGMIPPWI